MDPSINPLAQYATLPFKIIEEFGVPCGYERSFKMLPHTLLSNRFLLGINTVDLQRPQLIDICRQLDMPQDYRELFEANLAEANLVFLGFEDHEGVLIYKVYLEYWDKVKMEVSPDSIKHDPLLLHLGFKWNIQDRTKRSIAKYFCYPLLTVPDILTKISLIYEGDEGRTTATIAKEIIKLSARKASATSFIYLEVDEENGQRRSFDINLYSAQILVGELQPFLSTLAQSFSIQSDKLHRLYELVNNKKFGHLSGGVNKEGHDFLTVYYEM